MPLTPTLATYSSFGISSESSLTRLFAFSRIALVDNFFCCVEFFAPLLLLFFDEDFFAITKLFWVWMGT